MLIPKWEMMGFAAVEVITDHNERQIILKQ
jgi:hypothetical protein